MKEYNSPVVPKSEYKERRERLIKSCKEEGLEGALVLSRDSTIADRAGYSIYLANYQTKFFSGFFDFPPYWAWRGHSAVIVPCKGEAVLIKDLPLRNEIPLIKDKIPSFLADHGSLAISDFRYDYNMVRGVTRLLLEKGLYKGKVGLIGSNIISMKHFQEIHHSLPEVEWVLADDLLNKQMIIKSETELNIIRHACKAVSEVTDSAFDFAQPGISERELAIRVAQGLADQGCELCWIRPNSSRRLELGEIYCMGLVGWCQGYIFDISRNKVIGDSPNPKQAQLLNLINEFILRQAEELRPGRTAGEAARFGLRYFTEEKKEFSREEFEAGILGTFAAFGHGLGLAWERPILREEEDMVLKPGMYMAVEVVYHKSGTGLAEAEINLEITEKGPRILTKF